MTEPSTDEMSRAEAETPEVKKRVLIVEDERPLILLVSRTLSKLNFEVVGEVTVTAGLKRMEKEHFDALLVDYMLPERSGLDMIEALGDRVHEIPVVMLTGYSDVNLAVDAMRAGAADYLVKDARLEFIRDLPKVLGDLIEKYCLRRQNRHLEEKVRAGEVALEHAREHSGSVHRSHVEHLMALSTQVLGPLKEWAAEVDSCSDVPESLRKRGQTILKDLEELVDRA